jgi:hypothetical protein
LASSGVALWLLEMLGKKKRSILDPREAPRVERPKLPIGTMVRMFLLGSVAIVASIWAIWRHYTVPPSKMLVPASSHSGEIEIEP